MGYILLFIISMNILNACPVCYGSPNDPVTLGLNKAIFFLLLTIIFVLSCIIYGIFSLIQKSNKINIEGIK